VWGCYGVFYGALGVEWWLNRAVVVILGVYLGLAVVGPYPTSLALVEFLGCFYV